jgi:hypothetical protein
MRLIFIFAVTLGVAACEDTSPPAPRYFERVIQPILTNSCVRNQGACHKDDGLGNALGNLDLSSWDGVNRRRDLLRTYGSYPEPLLLAKGAGHGPPIPYRPGQGDGQIAFLETEIEHVGGAVIGRGSDAFYELQRWLADGATFDRTPVDPGRVTTDWGACSPSFAAIRPDLDPDSVQESDPLFQQFQQEVAPILARSCAFASCHSTPLADFFLTCPDGAGVRFDYLATRELVAAPPESSEFLLRTLAPAAGGVSHSGGVLFSDRQDRDYQALLAWATAVGPPPAPARSPGRQFFEERILPLLLQRGCAAEACHSAGAPNDFKLRAGSQGYFSPVALARNYDVARRVFLDAAVPDVRQSRLVKKALTRIDEGGVGLPHRGGPVLQSAGDPPGLDPDACPPWDPSSATAFCAFVEWHRRERADALAQGLVDPLTPGSTVPLVFVERPADADRAIEFDHYRPGADLVIADVRLGALGRVESISRRGSLLAGCPGTPSTRDVRRPDVDYDGALVAFAMRLAEADTLDLYVVGTDGSGCTKITSGNGARANGLPLHSFDPMFAPTTPSSLVFASTRGRPGVGPTLSLKYLLPQSDLWRLPGTAAGFGPAEQMTALNGSELQPAMMAKGQLIFSAERASADVYQISGRRLNWDLSDYHPLLGQRHSSRGYDPGAFATAMPYDALPIHPSIGYERVTEIREGSDGNFVMILSDEVAPGAGGALATFNRSLGPFEADRHDVTYLRSMEILDGDGHAAGAGYRSPLPLPDGRILASFTSDLSTGAYDLVVVDPAAPAGARRTTLYACAPRACVQPVLAVKRERKPPYTHTIDPTDPAHAVEYFPDLPLLATLLGANLRTGRFVDAMRSATEVAVYEVRPPADLATGTAGRTGSAGVFQDLHLLGTAPLAADGSVKLQLPSLLPILFELRDGAGQALFTMTEEDQAGPGERIGRGVPQPFFNSLCAGCHGSISGRELDIAINVDALTGASRTLSQTADPTPIGP